MTIDEQNSTDDIDVLIVEDDVIAARAMSKILTKDGYKNTTSLTLHDALAKVEALCPRLVLLDLTLPDGNGLEAMTQLKHCGVLEVIVVSGTDSPEHTRQCLRAGAFDFIAKPATASDIMQAVRRADALLKLENLSTGTYPFSLKPGFGSLEADNSTASVNMFKNIKRIAPHLYHGGCLIKGPAGALKNDIAACINHYSAASSVAYLINCATEDDDGALARFTGTELTERNYTIGSEQGYLQSIGEGTVVLDDLSYLSMDVQALIAKILDDRKLSFVGTAESTPYHCAFIGVLREDADAAIRDKRLHQGLYDTLAQNVVTVPSLLERSEDIAFFARKAVEQLNAIFSVEKSISSELMNKLEEHSWPGNLIELRNVILAAYRLTEPGEEIVENYLMTTRKGSPISSEIAPLIGTTLHDAERLLIQATLRTHGNNKRQAADILGISTKTLYNRLKLYEKKGSATETS